MVSVGKDINYNVCKGQSNDLKLRHFNKKAKIVTVTIDEALEAATLNIGEFTFKQSMA